jgi:hypothetical protein
MCEVAIREYSLSLHLHPHLHFNMCNVDGDAGKVPSH